MATLQPVPTQASGNAIPGWISRAAVSINAVIKWLNNLTDASGNLTIAYTPPQGRLTLSSGVPVQTADVAGAATIYYAPYISDQVPLYDGTIFRPWHISQLTLTLSVSAHLSGKVYDIFAFNNAGAVSLGTGPAWSTTTSRGTGAGTTELQQLNGLWVNKNTITLTNGASVFSNIAGNQALYLGSFYATANGQTSHVMNPAQTAGGAAPKLGLYNAYNRVRTVSRSSDSTASWTYATVSWRFANGSANNQVYWLDGLQQSAVIGSYGVDIAAPAGISGRIGVLIDGGGNPQRQCEVLNADIGMISEYVSPPLLGLHAMGGAELSSGATTTYSGGGTLGAWMQVTVSLEM